MSRIAFLFCFFSQSVRLIWLSDRNHTQLVTEKSKNRKQLLPYISENSRAVIRSAFAGPGYSEDVIKKLSRPFCGSAFPFVDTQTSFLGDGEASCTFCQNLELTS